MNAFNTQPLVDEIIAFYSSDFSEYYATVIAITERFPDQINNEIRNAFSHLARVKLALTQDQASDEARKAKGHLERACRDCLKLCIVEIRDKIRRQLDHIMIRHETIEPGIKAELALITKKRMELLRAEACGDENLTSNFKNLLEECLALDDKIYSVYGAVSHKKIDVLMFYFLKDGRSALKKGLSEAAKYAAIVCIIVVLTVIGMPSLMNKLGLHDQWQKFAGKYIASPEVTKDTVGNSDTFNKLAPAAR